jgi:hypothetical protein
MTPPFLLFSFCIVGDIELLKMAMTAMNAPADPDNSEERKGCSGRVGKMIFSAGVKQLAVVAYVPEATAEKVGVGHKKGLKGGGGVRRGRERGWMGKMIVSAGVKQGAKSPFQPKKENLKAVTFLNCNCILPESPGHRLIGETEFSFLLERAYCGLCAGGYRGEGEDRGGWAEKGSFLED